MSRRFRGRTVVITGASSGVGAAAARLFAAEGARVVLAARTAAALDAVAKEIGESAIAVPTDVSDPQQARALVERAVAETGDTGFITRDLDGVPDLVFSQPMSSAEDIGRAVVESAHDGRLERTIPRLSGALATAGYLFPDLPRLLRPVLDQQGRRAKERFRAKHEGH